MLPDWLDTGSGLGWGELAQIHFKLGTGLSYGSSLPAFSCLQLQSIEAVV